MDLTAYNSAAPYSWNRDEKAINILSTLLALTEHHRDNCYEYCNILATLGFSVENVKQITDLPYLPVSIFKRYDLKSVAQDEIVQTMTSSGTTTQTVSRILLDKKTAGDQKKALSHILSSYIGNTRLPLMILDSRKTLADPSLLGARGAGILGFTIYGRDITFALDDEMNLDIDAIISFLEKHSNSPMLLFGYTFMIWQHFYLAIKDKGININFQKNAKLFHVGGWKKLQDMAVDTKHYNKALFDTCNIDKIFNYYGMAEQLGSIFVSCEHDKMHVSNYSEVIIRRPHDFSPAEIGEKGLIQICSVLPHSYPGHSLLTEDEGVLLGEDDCSCGRKGKYFKILGRAKNAELRGCSDTYADKFRKY